MLFVNVVDDNRCKLVDTETWDYEWVSKTSILNNKIGFIMGRKNGVLTEVSYQDAVNFLKAQAKLAGRDLDFNYVVDSKALNLVNTCDKSAVVIDKSVKVLGSLALSGKPITKVVAPSLLHVYEAAFHNCVYLVSAYIPKVHILDKHIFYNCKSLKSVEFYPELEEMGSGCFKGCVSLDSICLSNSLVEICSETFSGCTSLKHITLPESLASIMDYAFFNCKSLREIKIPRGVKYVGREVFSSCTNLEVIRLPKGMLSSLVSLLQNGNYAQIEYY